MKLSEKLYSRAMSNFQTGNLDEALEEIDHCVQLLRKTAILLRKRQGPDFRRFIDAKILQGRIYSAKGSTEEVDEIINYLKTLNMSGDDQGDYLQGKVYYFLYDLRIDSSEEEALKYLEKAKESFVSAGHYDDAIEILFDLQRAQKFRKNKDSLMDLYDEILDLNKKIRDKDIQKSNSGRARLQIARLLARSDLKKSRKSLIKAYNDLIDNPSLQLDSMVYLASMYLYDSEGKMLDVLKKIEKISDRPYDKVRTLLFKLILSIRKEDINEGSIYKDVLGEMSNITVDTKLADQILDTGRFIAIYGDLSKHQQMKDVLKYGIDCFDAQGDKQGKIIGYIIEGLLTNNEEERENRMKLVDVYSKSLKDMDKQYLLRSQTLDIINWVGNDDKSIEDGKLVESVKNYYNHDRIKQAETLNMLAMYKTAKENTIPTSIFNEAKNHFKKSKFDYSDYAIHKIEDMMASQN